MLPMRREQRESVDGIRAVKRHFTREWAAYSRLPLDDTREMKTSGEFDAPRVKGKNSPPVL
jgi:hypothetical protein